MKNNFKNNIVKYIFIIVVIGLIIFAVYTIYKDENRKGENKTPEKQTETTQIKELRLGITDFDTLNPILSNNKKVQDISKIIYEPLFNVTQDYHLENCLAEECSRTGDTSYILKLKKNVKWQNGTDFTAKDVQFTIDRLKDTPSIYSYNVQYVISVEVIDDYTIRINLDRSIPFFEYNLTFPIMSNSYYANEDFANSEKNAHPVGTGMFQISEVKENVISLKKNTNWWNAENKNAVLEKVTIKLYSSMGEVYNAFKTGNIDVVNTNSSNVEEFIGKIGYTSKEYAGREHDFIAINFKNELLEKEEVRKAISYAIDKANIVSAVYNNKYTVANFPLDYGNYLYTSQDGSSGYNPDQVKQILEDNGWSYKNKIWQKREDYKTRRLEFNFVVNSSNAKRVEVAKIIEEQLENQGIKINLIQANDKQYQNYLDNKNYDLILTGTNVSPSPDLATYFGEENLANYHNDEVTSIMNDIGNIKDEATLKEKYARLADIYKTDIPYISLYFNKVTTAYSSNLIGDISPNWYNYFYHIETWYRQ